MENKVAPRHAYIDKRRARNITWVALILIMAGVILIIAPFVYLNYILPIKESRLLGETFTDPQSITEIANADNTVPDKNTNIDNTGVQDTKTFSNNTGVADKRLSAEDYSPAEIIIPLIDLNETIYEGTDSETLKLGPGHIKGTPFPGQEGRSVISGHRTTYGAPFSRLDELKSGDIIYIETVNKERYTFEVVQIEIVSPKDLDVLIGSAKKQLVLTTCTPRFTATKRLIIIADLKEQ